MVGALNIYATYVMKPINTESDRNQWKKRESNLLL